MSIDLVKSAEEVLTFFAYRPGIRRRLVDSLELGIRGQHLESDRTTGHTTVLDENGVPMPAVVDTTGEAAISRDDARVLLAEVDRAERDIVLVSMRITGQPNLTSTIPAVIYRYAEGPDSLGVGGTIKRCGSVFARATGDTVKRRKLKPSDLSHLAADGEPGCQSCARYVKPDGIRLWNHPGYNEERPTDLGGALPRRVLLCRPCYRFAVEQDPIRLPSVKELAARHQDPRGRWPGEGRKRVA